MGYLQNARQEKTTVKTIRNLKGVRPIVCITAYDALFASLVDPYVDLILVGDSVANTLLGYEDTVMVSLDMICHHSAAVSRAKPRALVVADLPFTLAYESMDKLLVSARRLMQEGGVQAIKIEVGNESLFPKIATLVDAGIPVIGHIGLLPQNIHALGSYRSYGNREEGKQRLLAWAKALEAAGCFAVLGEMIQPDASAMLSESLTVPFIGIGCGNRCDGQILVLTDLLGLGRKVPGFAKQYANLAEGVRSAVSLYSTEVEQRKFPEK
jgi:3-methyl-2-oxobutanoate hydroxymethyltransferase